jgi:prepilin-type processing-associated H-X9-DG protein
MKRRDAFTLTELLVLIATGTLAGSLLLASLGDAKEKVQAAACMSNLREISLAVRLYTDDNGGYMPTASADLVTWPKRLGPYLPLRGPNPTSPPHRVFTCPTAEFPGYEKSDISLTYSCTAAMLGRSSPPGGDITPGSTFGLTAAQPRRASQVYTAPAQTPLIIEGKKDPAGTTANARSNCPWIVPFASVDLASPGPSYCFYLDFRHNDAMNIAFFDGSVRLVTFAQATNQFTKSLWEGR